MEKAQKYKHFYHPDMNRRIELLKNWHKDLALRNRGDRAELRRCYDLESILRCRAFHDNFYPHLMGASTDLFLNENTWRAWAMIAGIGAHIKKINNNYAPAQWGEKANGDARKLSELRFQRLLQGSADNWEKFYRLLRQSLGILKFETDFILLSSDILFLAQEKNKPSNEIVRTVSFRWLRDYYHCEAADENSTQQQGASS